MSERSKKGADLLALIVSWATGVSHKVARGRIDAMKIDQSWGDLSESITLLAMKDEGRLKDAGTQAMWRITDLHYEREGFSDTDKPNESSPADVERKRPVGRPKREIDRAKAFLSTMLWKDPIRKKDLVAEAERHGISKTTLERAAKILGAKGRMWSLETKDAQ